MQCPQCSAKIAELKGFCSHCGAPLAVTCAACGAETGPDDKFCSSCGTPLGLSVSEPRHAATAPDHLAKKALAGRGVMEGQRRQVTVLFTDLEGYTPLAERPRCIFVFNTTKCIGIFMQFIFCSVR